VPHEILGMGVRSDHPELQSTMEKVFEAAPKCEKAAVTGEMICSEDRVWRQPHRHTHPTLNKMSERWNELWHILKKQ
jgi:hypothetical protein